MYALAKYPLTPISRFRRVFPLLSSYKCLFVCCPANFCNPSLYLLEILLSSAWDAVGGQDIAF